jgi:hypothetical protein
MSKKEMRFFCVLGGIAVGWFLLSSPSCGQGCRTFAEHLITHGIDQLL